MRIRSGGFPRRAAVAHRTVSGAAIAAVVAAVVGAWAGAGAGAGGGSAEQPPGAAAGPAQPVVWRADAERPLTDEWASMTTALSCAQPSRATDQRFARVLFPVAQGASAYRSEVRDGDRCYGERSEVGQANPLRPGFSGPLLFRPGQVRWISFQIYLGKGFPVDVHTWQLVAQWKQLGGLAEPILSLGVRDGRWELLATPADPRATDGFRRFSAGPARTGRWTRFTLHVRFSSNPREGALALFGDRGRRGPTRRLLALTHLATLKVDPARGSEPVDAHARIGIYRDRRISGTAVAYYDAYTVAIRRWAAEQNVPQPQPGR
jgi:hypothetical protein